MSMAIILGIEPEIIKMAPAANTVRNAKIPAA
jgi:UDP-N-acetylglucosamine 2-epimerase